ncbi:MAG: hypothetical protein ACREQQ_05555 [Candidatus Binatia bacterium]
MRIAREEYILHPADRVYPLVRDRIYELLPKLPGVESIEILSRAAEGKGKTRVRSRWKLRPPAFLRPLLPSSAFVWEEDALWIDKKYCVESRVRGFGYESRARTFYEPASDYTRVRIEAAVSFRPESVEIPKANLDKILAGAEQALREAIEPNMTALLEAIGEHLGERSPTEE